MNKIREFLAENQLTQVEAARRLGYSPEYLNRIMQGGDDITPAFCWRWLETFGPDTLRYLNGDAEPHHDPAR